MTQLNNPEMNIFINIKLTITLSYYKKEIFMNIKYVPEKLF